MPSNERASSAVARPAAFDSKVMANMRCCQCRHKACDSMDQTGLPLQSLPLQLGCREGQNCQSPNLLVRKSLCPRYQHWGSQTWSDSMPVILQNRNLL